MTRTMIVESRTEDKNGTIYELRNTNKLPHSDDRFTLVVKASDEEPRWKIGQSVSVEVK